VTVTDVLAVIGAVTGITGTLLALAALGWDYYKWRYAERVQLKVSANPGFINPAKPKQTFISVVVTNIGKIPTTINLLSLHGFDTKAELENRNGKNVAVVHRPLYGTLPARVEPGNEWVGGIDQNSNGIEVYLKYKYFIVQIEDTMSTKPFRAEIDKSRLLEV
jgi:hypothetical protein